MLCADFACGSLRLDMLCEGHCRGKMPAALRGPASPLLPLRADPPGLGHGQNSGLVASMLSGDTAPAGVSASCRVPWPAVLPLSPSCGRSRTAHCWRAHRACQLWLSFRRKRPRPDPPSSRPPLEGHSDSGHRARVTPPTCARCWGQAGPTLGERSRPIDVWSLAEDRSVDDWGGCWQSCGGRPMSARLSPGPVDGAEDEFIGCRL